MKKMISVLAIGLAAVIFLAATGSIEPLKAKTGLWQITETSNWTLPPQFPPQYAAVLRSGVPHTYQSCVHPKDLSSNPWAQGVAGHKCSWTVLKSNGTDMQVQGSCDLSRELRMPATAQGTGKIHMVDSENATGSEDIALTFNGMTAKDNASYTGKWIGASCPARMN